MKGKNHPHDVDNAGKYGRRVQLHQDGQEDVRKALFHGQFVSIWPVLVVFLAKKAYQTTGLGVVRVGSCPYLGMLYLIITPPSRAGRFGDFLS